MLPTRTRLIHVLGAILQSKLVEGLLWEMIDRSFGR